MTTNIAPPSLPGYYYDAEKNKYFKIEGPATPQTSAYSSQDVKRRQERDNHEGAKAKKVKRELARPRRFAQLDNSISGITMRREQGDSSGFDGYCGILAAGLEGQGTHRPGYGLWAENIEPYFHIERCVLRPEFFQVHSAHEDFIKSSLASFGGPFNPQSTQLKYGNPGVTTSLSYHETEKVCVATWLSGTTSSGIGLWHGLDSSRLGNLYGPGPQRGPEPDVFTSTAAPASSTLLFVFGTSRGILTLDKEDKNLRWLNDKNNLIPRDHYIALEYLSTPGSKPPFTLLGGCRNGHIHNLDLRVPDLGHDSIIIRHPSAVTHIKQIDEHRIIVPGLKSIMRQYDLRYLKLTKQQPPLFKSPIYATDPFVSYSGYKNEATITAGFDIDTESGIIAASQEGGPYVPYVQLFSIKSGKTLPSPSVNTTIPRHPIVREGGKVIKYAGSPPKCLQFVRDKEGEMKSLFISNPRGHIQRFSWGGGETED